MTLHGTCQGIGIPGARRTASRLAIATTAPLPTMPRQGLRQGSDTQPSASSNPQRSCKALCTGSGQECGGPPTRLRDAQAQRGGPLEPQPCGVSATSGGGGGGGGREQAPQRDDSGGAIRSTVRVDDEALPRECNAKARVHPDHRPFPCRRDLRRQGVSPRRGRGSCEGQSVQSRRVWQRESGRQTQPVLFRALRSTPDTFRARGAQTRMRARP